MLSVIANDFGPDSFEPPFEQGGDGDCSHEVLDIAIEASGYAAPVLQSAEDPFDEVVLAVDGPVVLDLDLAV